MAATHTLTVEQQQDQRASEAIGRERARLWSFIRSHIPDREEAEDILQEVFYELIRAYRLAQPVEQAGAWMFRVARNRITDWFRKKRPDPMPVDEAGMSLADLLPAPGGSPEAAYANRVLTDALLDALAELPEQQRYAFVEHEINGRSFQELAAETGVALNTLLSRKRYAVRHLRRQLEGVYEEFKRSQR